MLIVIYGGPNGAPCGGGSGYTDIDAGTQVVVKNESGAIIGTGMLQAGHQVPAGAPAGPEDYVCLFDFTPIRNVPRAVFYGVEVSHRGQQNYAYDEIRKVNWQVNQFLGS